MKCLRQYAIVLWVGQHMNSHSSGDLAAGSTCAGADDSSAGCKHSLEASGHMTLSTTPENWEAKAQARVSGNTSCSFSTWHLWLTKKLHRYNRDSPNSLWNLKVVTRHFRISFQSQRTFCYILIHTGHGSNMSSQSLVFSLYELNNYISKNHSKCKVLNW